MITETPRLRIRELTVGDAEFWRRGFAYEAACAVMEYGRVILGIEKIVGLTSEENVASIKALEKLGMSFEKIVKMSDDDPGTALYS